MPLLGYEVDFLWPAAKFVVEADGGDHLNRAQRDEDNRRDIALGRAGHLVRRYSSGAMADEGAVAAEVLEILAERLGREAPPGHEPADDAGRASGAVSRLRPCARSESLPSRRCPAGP